MEQHTKPDEQVIAEFIFDQTPAVPEKLVEEVLGAFRAIINNNSTYDEECVSAVWLRDVDRKIAEMKMINPYLKALAKIKCTQGAMNGGVWDLMTATDAQRVRAAAETIRGMKGNDDGKD